MQRSSSRPRGMIQALAKPAWGAVWLFAGMLVSRDAAAEPAAAKPRPKVDCHSIPAGAALPPECRKAGSDADGDKVPDDVDRCPSAPEDLDGFEDEDGCPDPDNDGDGALDEEDGCPLEAEDRDGFKDADGCPEPDNDGDGVLDIRDVCPLEAESFDGSGDGDGCPALLMVAQRLEPEPPPHQRRHSPERPPTMPVMPPAPAAPAGAHATAAARATAGAHAAVNAQAAAGPLATAGAHTTAAATSPVRPAATAHVTPSLAPVNAPAKLAARSTLEPATREQCPDGGTPTPEGECLARLDPEKIRISDTVQFAYGTETLLEASHPTLDQVVDILDGHPNLRVMIVGHADARGKDESNLRLSMLRAVNVRAYLLQQSRDPQSLARRLEAVGIGSRQPLGDNHSAVGRSHNRRVEFLVTSDRWSPGRQPPPAARAPAAPNGRAATQPAAAKHTPAAKHTAAAQPMPRPEPAAKPAAAHH